MNVDLRYLGRSEAREASWGTALRLSPNLARPKVFYDAQIADPVRFREAICALHEVVVPTCASRRKTSLVIRLGESSKPPTLSGCARSSLTKRRRRNSSRAWPCRRRRRNSCRRDSS